MIGDTGYCLKLERAPRERVPILIGTEDEMPATCGQFCRRVNGLDQGAFIAWRDGIENLVIQKAWAERAKTWTIIGAIIAAASLVTAVAQLVGGS